MKPQLARLTATLRKRQQQGNHVASSDVVFRAISPHGHVDWEINPAGRAGAVHR